MQAGNPKQPPFGPPSRHRPGGCLVATGLLLILLAWPLWIFQNLPPLTPALSWIPLGAGVVLTAIGFWIARRR